MRKCKPVCWVLLTNSQEWHVIHCTWANLSWGGDFKYFMCWYGAVFSLGTNTYNIVYFACVASLDKLLLNFTASNTHKVKPGIRHNLWQLANDPFLHLYMLLAVLLWKLKCPGWSFLAENGWQRLGHSWKHFVREEIHIHSQTEKSCPLPGRSLQSENTLIVLHFWGATAALRTDSTLVLRTLHSQLMEKWHN